MDAKDTLLNLIQTAYDQESNFMRSLDQADRLAQGESDHWAVKDIIVHIAEWRQMMVARFRAAEQHTPPPEYDDLDAMNEEIFQRHREDSWQEIQSLHELSHHQLVEQVQSIAGEALVDPDSYPWLKGRSLWKRTLHNGYFHPLGHIAMLFSERGEKDRGDQIMEEVTDTMMSLDESARWKGQCKYNLACYYALSGDKRKTIETLSKAFALSGDMIEYSRRDSDLASVWDEPEYHALVGV